MVREWRPRERGLSSLKLARRSTMTTSVPANVSSAASIIPVGPPPAITTACSVIRHPHFRRLWFRDSAARPGSCRKPPGALYTENGKEWLVSFPGSIRAHAASLTSAENPPSLLRHGLLHLLWQTGDCDDG